MAKELGKYSHSITRYVEDFFQNDFSSEFDKAVESLEEFDDPIPMIDLLQNQSSIIVPSYIIRRAIYVKFEENVKAIFESMKTDYPSLFSEDDFVDMTKETNIDWHWDEKINEEICWRIGEMVRRETGIKLISCENLKEYQIGYSKQQRKNIFILSYMLSLDEKELMKLLLSNNLEGLSPRKISDFVYEYVKDKYKYENEYVKAMQFDRILKKVKLIFEKNKPVKIALSKELEPALARTLLDYSVLVVNKNWGNMDGIPKIGELRRIYEEMVIQYPRQLSIEDIQEIKGEFNLDCTTIFPDNVFNRSYLAVKKVYRLEKQLDRLCEVYNGILSSNNNTDYNFLSTLEILDRKDELSGATNPAVYKRKTDDTSEEELYDFITDNITQFEDADAYSISKTNQLKCLCDELIKILNLEEKAVGKEKINVLMNNFLRRVSFYEEKNKKGKVVLKSKKEDIYIRASRYNESLAENSDGFYSFKKENVDLGTRQTRKNLFTEFYKSINSDALRQSMENVFSNKKNAKRENYLILICSFILEIFKMDFDALKKLEYRFTLEMKNEDNNYECRKVYREMQQVVAGMEQLKEDYGETIDCIMRMVNRLLNSMGEPDLYLANLADRYFWISLYANLKGKHEWFEKVILHTMDSVCK